MNQRLVTFPHMGNYYIAEKPIALLFGDDIIPPPRITKRTLEIGAKYSPESVCIPFKYTLGNFIEALDLGATVVLQAGAGCRMGLYSELQNEILKKLGYQFEFVKMLNDNNIISITRYLKKLNPHFTYMHIVKTLYLAYEKAGAIDYIEEIVRKNIGFEATAGTFEGVYKSFLSALDRAATTTEVKEVRERYSASFAQIPVVKPDHLLRVGLIGEIYLLMEPFSNFFIEKELAHYGIELYRHITITGAVHHNFAYKNYIKNLTKTTVPYLHNGIGGHGTESVAVALDLAKHDYDGLIHVKPFGCMPEVDAMPALHRISRDFKIPTLYFSFDTLTSETGIKTRLEAFYDMLVMREVNHAG